MMKMKKKQLLQLLFVCAIVLVSVLGMATTSKAKTKSILVSSIEGNKLSYYNCYLASDYLGEIEWENLIGGGKLKTITISPKASYALFDFSKMKNYVTTRDDFIAEIPKVEKEKENGKIWYWGMAAKITIKNGKVTSIKRLYQS